jgi:DNA-binding transcriptional ArsR family regulator
MGGFAKVAADFSRVARNSPGGPGAPFIRPWRFSDIFGSERRPARMPRRPQTASAALTESDEVFETAAEVFRVMSAPMRLKIISSLCNGEKNVSELLAEIDTTQPNMSQHLNTLYQAGVLGKRREGVQIYYRIVNDRVVTLCRAVCMQVAIEADLQ